MAILTCSQVHVPSTGSLWTRITLCNSARLPRYAAPVAHAHLHTAAHLQSPEQVWCLAACAHTAAAHAPFRPSALFHVLTSLFCAHSTLPGMGLASSTATSASRCRASAGPRGWLGCLPHREQYTRAACACTGLSERVPMLNSHFIVLSHVPCPDPQHSSLLAYRRPASGVDQLYTINILRLRI